MSTYVKVVGRRIHYFRFLFLKMGLQGWQYHHLEFVENSESHPRPAESEPASYPGAEKVGVSCGDLQSGYVCRDTIKGWHQQLRVRVGNQSWPDALPSQAANLAGTATAETGQ